MAVSAVEQEEARRSLKDFIELSWHVLHPNTPFIDNWHIGCVCEHLQAMSDLQIRKLVINEPPSCMKSIATLAWTAWDWIDDPWSRWFVTASDQSLVTRDSRRCRDLITSEWYQERWGDRFSVADDPGAKKAENWFSNDKHGYRMAKTVGEAVIGHKANYIIADDPNSLKGIWSRLKRHQVVEWWTQGMQRVAENPRTARYLIIQQRLHENDLSGYVLAQELGYEALIIPMKHEPVRYFFQREADKPLPKNAIVLTRLQQERPELRDPRTEPGELLWPDMYDEEAVADRERHLMEYGTASQHQQRPGAAGGNIFKDSYFKYFHLVSHRDEDHVRLVDGDAERLYPVKALKFFQCIDTALEETETSAFTAIGTFAITPAKELLTWYVWQDRLSVPEQYSVLMAWRDGPVKMVRDPDGRKRIMPLGKWPKRLVLQGVEKKASGIGLIQEGKARGKPFYPLSTGTKSKVERAGPVTSLYYAGMVYHRAGAAWLNEYEEALKVFPASEFLDMADVTSYAGHLVQHERILTAGLDRELVMDFGSPPEPERSFTFETATGEKIEINFPDD